MEAITCEMRYKLSTWGCSKAICLGKLSHLRVTRCGGGIDSLVSICHHNACVNWGSQCSASLTGR